MERQTKSRNVIIGGIWRRLPDRLYTPGLTNLTSCLPLLAFQWQLVNRQCIPFLISQADNFLPAGKTIKGLLPARGLKRGFAKSGWLG